MTADKNTLEDLIDALTILRKYGNPSYPTHCEHDALIIYGINCDKVSVEDVELLHELGFTISTEYGDETFVSYRFGSA